MDEGYLRRNPARMMERPTVVAMAPTELSEKQRFVLRQLVEQHASLLKVNYPSTSHCLMEESYSKKGSASWIILL